MSDDTPRLLEADRCAIVLVDLQARLASAMPQADWEAVRGVATRLAQAAAHLGLPLFATRQYPSGLGDLDGTVRAALPGGADVIDKTCFAAGGADALGASLAMTERDQVLIAGMEAHVCVLQTAATLRAAGYAAHVAADAVCSRDPAHAENALARMRGLGVEVTNHESVLFECLRDAAHPRFKAVSKLLR